MIFNQIIRYKSGIVNQLRWLLWRNGLAIIRDKSSIFILIFQSIFMSIMYGLIFFQTKMNQEGIQNINSLFYLIEIYVCVIHLYAVVNVSSFYFLIFKILF
jgi:hypothetical protein